MREHTTIEFSHNGAISWEEMTQDKLQERLYDETWLYSEERRGFFSRFGKYTRIREEIKTFTFEEAYRFSFISKNPKEFWFCNPIGRRAVFPNVRVAGNGRMATGSAHRGR